MVNQAMTYLASLNLGTIQGTGGILYCSFCIMALFRCGSVAENLAALGAGHNGITGSGAGCRTGVSGFVMVTYCPIGNSGSQRSGRNRRCNIVRIVLTAVGTYAILIIMSDCSIGINMIVGVMAVHTFVIFLTVSGAGCFGNGLLPLVASGLTERCLVFKLLATSFADSF